MTPIGELLSEEIRRTGPIPFHRFMEVALYHPGARLLPPPARPIRRARRFLHRRADPAGLRHPDGRAHPPAPPRHGRPADFTVVELGAGRGEMAEAFSEWRYVPVDLDAGGLPERFAAWSSPTSSSTPCRWRWPSSAVARSASSAWASRTAASCWHGQAAPSPPEIGEHLRRYFPAAEEGRWYEANLEALEWMERIGRALEAGYVLTIDYGYTRAGVHPLPRRNADGIPPPHRARRRAGGSRRARHHGARQLHRA